MEIVHTELKALLKEIWEFQEAEEIDNFLFDKVVGVLLPGSKVEVYWQDREYTDEGYVFTLPQQDANMWDICIHIPKMDNSDGIGEGEEAFVHLYSLLQLERVLKVVIIPQETISGEINTNDAEEEMGLLIDRLDNLAHALVMPLPLSMHVDSLRQSLPEVVREMKSAFVKLTNEDPWGLNLDEEQS